MRKENKWIIYSLVILLIVNVYFAIAKIDNVDIENEQQDICYFNMNTDIDELHRLIEDGKDVWYRP